MLIRTGTGCPPRRTLGGGAAPENPVAALRAIAQEPHKDASMQPTNNSSEPAMRLSSVLRQASLHPPLGSRLELAHESQAARRTPSLQSERRTSLRPEGRAGWRPRTAGTFHERPSMDRGATPEPDGHVSGLGRMAGARRSAAPGRANGTPGSVRGRSGNWLSYRDDSERRS
jgi:hypothetical protein